LGKKYKRIRNMKNETVTMYRPVGPGEYELLEKLDFRAWPPRLNEQPIFYPVTNQKYAEEITIKWNVRDYGIGYVTKFEVLKSFADKFKIEQVGDNYHTEWWIPSDALDELNECIVGKIEVLSKHT
jgi:hypothetical protein